MNITKPIRAARTYVQHLVGSAEQVFPLLCPVREVDWAVGWDPINVITHSGVAEPECVFTTPASPGPAIWFITRHDPERAFVEMLKVTPEVTACRLTIQVASAEFGCTATVTYSHTSLGPRGDAFVAGFTEEFYAGFMREWEAQLNHYLKTGQKLEDAPA